jgi:hypothetical protein
VRRLLERLRAKGAALAEATKACEAQKRRAEDLRAFVEVRARGCWRRPPACLPAACLRLRANAGCSTLCRRLAVRWMGHTGTTARHSTVHHSTARHEHHAPHTADTTPAPHVLQVLTAFCDDPRDLAAVRASEAALRTQLEQLRLELQGSDPQVGGDAAGQVLPPSRPPPARPRPSLRLVLAGG